MGRPAPSAWTVRWTVDPDVKWLVGAALYHGDEPVLYCSPDLMMRSMTDRGLLATDLRHLIRWALFVDTCSCTPDAEARVAHVTRVFQDGAPRVLGMAYADVAHLPPPSSMGLYS
ncbi:hypothetical protein WJX74_007715 [Apatococcus lobatus]|uniref:Uncharacterized protein n=1 Tax=Apatococcus lobatus TaxID=904363 RepID=A0AAW1R031_9CHLO